MTDTEDIHLDNWETVKELDHDITVKLSIDTNPLLSAAFDGDKLISEPVSHMQHEEVIWFADGYSDAKGEYGISHSDLSE